MTLILMIGSAVLNGIAQILRKLSTEQELTSTTLFEKVISFATNPRFLGGAALYAISILIRIYVLTQEEVSTAYPILAVAFIVVTVGGYFLGESMSLLKILGILAIILGVVLLTINHG